MSYRKQGRKHQDTRISIHSVPWNFQEEIKQKPGEMVLSMKCFSYGRTQVLFLEPTEESPGLVSLCVILAPGRQRGRDPETLWPASRYSVSSRPGTDYLSEHKVNGILRNNTGGWPLVFVCTQVYPLIHICTCGYTHIHMLAGNENIIFFVLFICFVVWLSKTMIPVPSLGIFPLFAFLIKPQWVFVLSYFILLLETLIKKEMKTFKSFFWWNELLSCVIHGSSKMNRMFI